MMEAVAVIVVCFFSAWYGHDLGTTSVRDKCLKEEKVVIFDQKFECKEIVQPVEDEDVRSE